jgi:hypothetical protein
MSNTTIFIPAALLLTASPIFADAPAWPSMVKGYGATETLAQKDGLREAVRLVAEYIRAIDPRLRTWEVTEEFIKKYLLDGPGSHGPDVKIGNDDKVKTWIYQMKPADHELFIQLNRVKERQALSETRLVLTGWLFSGVLAMLFLAMMYLRLTGDWRSSRLRRECSATESRTTKEFRA